MKPAQPSLTNTSGNYTMTTLQIDVLNPKATRLLEDLVVLDLIAIRQTGSEGFKRFVDQLRTNVDDVPSLDETTTEVETVRAERDVKRLVTDLITAYISLLDIAILRHDFNESSLKGYSRDFSNLVDIVSKELVRQNLTKSVELAEKHGLSDIKMNDIDQEIKVARDKRYEEQQLITGLQTVMAGSQAFSFLEEDDDLYTVDDLKVLRNE